MTLDSRDAEMGDADLKAWLDTLSSRYISANVKKRVFAEANAHSRVPDLINGLYLNSVSPSVIKSLDNIWNNFVLTEANSLIDDERFHEFLKLSESFYAVQKFDVPTAHKLVRLALPHFEIEDISSSLTLYLVNANLQDPISGKVLRKFKNSNAATFISATQYLRRKIPEDVAGAKNAQNFDRFSIANPNFGKIDEHTLVFITEKIRHNLASYLTGLVESDCEFLIINEKIAADHQILQPDNEKARVDFVEKISFEYDPEIFEQANLLSRAVFDHLLKSAEDSQLKEFLKLYEPALLIRFRDLLTPGIREEHYFKSLAASSRIKNVIIIGDKSSAEALASYGHVNAKPIAYLSSEGVFEAVSPADETLEGDIEASIKSHPRLPPFDSYIPQISPDLDGYLLLVANLTDRQTWGNMLPLLPELAKRRPLYVFPAPANMNRVTKYVSGYTESVIQDALEGPNVFLPKINKKKKPVLLIPIDNIETQLASLAAGLHKNKLGLPWPLSKNRRVGRKLKATRYALLKSVHLIDRALQHASHIAAIWEPITRPADSVLVCPGRHLESAMITCLAKKYNIPTYELQNGTISASGRFVKPITDIVFANDTFSAKVYDKLGMTKDKIKLVGSPRIDNGLASLRNISMAEAKKQVFGHEFNQDRKVIMFASQPLGPEISTRLFRLVASAVKQLANHTLLLRPHPSETKADLEGYMREMADIGLSSSRFILSARHSLELQAVDAVCTYYSTMGMEALALNKPVVCVAPDDSTLPFDLCQLGAMGPCRTISDLAHQFENAAPTAFPKGEVPAFAQGESVAKIIKAIC